MKQFAVLIAAAVLLHICNVADAALPSSFSAFQSLNREKIRHGDTRIKALPGFHGKFPSKHYGGYITVDEDHGRSLYYYFVESQHRPSKAPVVLWLNGGPGCSSLDGFIYENGPFNFAFGDETQGDLQVSVNKHAWSKVANVIYLDSPAGVGLSYSNTPRDYVTNDTATAVDTNTFLRRFFEEYPEFLRNDLYIAGESYAGVYVPMLAQAVMNGNDDRQKPFLNLKGYSLGNAVTDRRFDGNALVPFARGHSLISPSLFAATEQACSGEYWNATGGSKCDRMIDAVYHQISGVNLYNILDSCHHQSNGAQLRSAHLGARQERLGHTPSCLASREMWVFANSDVIRRAIHAASISQIGRFDECSDRITYTSDRDATMLPIHADLIARGLRALVYSGDVDMCLPFTGTEAWTASLQLPVKRQWQQWHCEGQVAGFTVAYSGLDYVTVRGAGHMVPQLKPAEAFQMFSRWLEGKRI